MHFGLFYVQLFSWYGRMFPSLGYIRLESSTILASKLFVSFDSTFIYFKILVYHEYFMFSLFVVEMLLLFDLILEKPFGWQYEYDILIKLRQDENQWRLNLFGVAKSIVNGFPKLIE